MRHELQQLIGHTISGVPLLLAFVAVSAGLTTAHPEWERPSAPPVSPGREPASRPAQPAPMSAVVQWACVTGIIEAALAQTHQAIDQHHSAGQQIDAAEYALHQMLEELEPVMVTSAKSPLRRRASGAPEVLIRALTLAA